ncbi:MAG: PDZ domain-containing protein [Gammaproteobacteria bacterium]|nr:PDZ domain-containing protein [Gammaproteobacteria bacterium]
MKRRQFKWITSLCLLGVLSVQLLAKDDDNADNEARENSQAEVLNGVDVMTTEIENAARVLSELESEAMADFISHQMGIIFDPERIAPAIHYLFDTIGQTQSWLFDSSSTLLGIEFELNDQQLSVKSLNDDSPFKSNGLRTGDVIVSVNGTQVPSDNLRTTFPEFMVNQIAVSSQPLMLKISRDDEIVELEVPTNQETWQDYFYQSTLVQTPNDQNLPLNRFFAREVQQSRLVLMEIESDLGQYFDVEFGVLVLQAPERSLLKPGDILLEVEDQKIRAISHVRKSLRDRNEKVEARVKRRSKNIQIQSDLTGMIIREIEEE